VKKKSRGWEEKSSKTGQNNTDQNSPIERKKMYKESERL
jgi:hypothetical protein